MIWLKISRIDLSNSFIQGCCFFSKYIHSLNNENVFYFSGKKDKTEDSWLNGQPY